MVHTLVRDAILSFWDRAEARGRACAVAEIPLYFECGWHKAGGLPGALSLTVRCPREIRLQRIMATRGWSEEKAATLEAWQWPAERKGSGQRPGAGQRRDTGGPSRRVPALLEQLAALRQKRLGRTPPAAATSGQPTPLPLAHAYRTYHEQQKK